MKKNIHPQWYHQAKITCSCGNTFTTGLTQPELNVDICSQCHPFFTGEMKFGDRQGRVDKFLAKQKAALLAQSKIKKSQKNQPPQPPIEVKSYQEILREQQHKLRNATKNA